MYVRGVESGVCGFYTTLHTEYCYSCQRCRRLLYSSYSGLSPLPGGKAIYLSFLSWGFSGSLPVSPRGQLCFKMFWDLSNYKGDCTANPQFLNAMGGGAQQPSNSYISTNKVASSIS